MADGARLVQAAGVLVQQLDEQLLLMREGSSDVIHLDAVASDAWRLLAASPTREELAQELADLYGVEADRVADDLDPVLAALLEGGVVLEQRP